MALVSHCLKHSLVSMTTILSGILHLPCGFPLCLLGWFLFLCLIPGHHCSLSRSWLLLVLSLRLMTLNTCAPRGFCIFLSSPGLSLEFQTHILRCIKKKIILILSFSFSLFLAAPSSSWVKTANKPGNGTSPDMGSVSTLVLEVQEFWEIYADCLSQARTNVFTGETVTWSQVYMGI